MRAALAASLALAASPAAAQTDCTGYADLFAAGRYAEAESKIQGLLMSPDCRDYTGDLYYSLALALERQQPPRSACHIADLYEAVTRNADLAQELRVAARARSQEAEARCALGRDSGLRSAALGLQASPEPTATPTPSRALPWSLTVSAAALALLGGGLLHAASEADAGRERAADVLRDYQLRLEGGALLNAAEEAHVIAVGAYFDDSAERARAFAIGGWASLGVGLGLGALAIWAWQQDPGDDASAVQVGLAPGGLSLSWSL